VSLDDEQPALVVTGVRMSGEVSGELFHNGRDCFRMIAHFQSDYSLVLRRRISDDVREVAVQGEQNRVLALSLGDYHGVRRVPGNEIPKPQYLVAKVFERADNRVGNAMRNSGDTIQLLYFTAIPAALSGHRPESPGSVQFG
jgi:hypothetical protein